MLKDFVPEAAGILITVALIDRLNRRRDERNAEKQLQEQLVRDASSIVNDVANNAVHQLRKRDWLEGDDGSLIGKDLRLANLEYTDFEDADLRGVNLGGVLDRAKLNESTRLPDGTFWTPDTDMTRFTHPELHTPPSDDAPDV